jgi:hypothetical protein
VPAVQQQHPQDSPRLRPQPDLRVVAHQPQLRRLEHEGTEDNVSQRGGHCGQNVTRFRRSVKPPSLVPSFATPGARGEFDDFLHDPP